MGHFQIYNFFGFWGCFGTSDMLSMRVVTINDRLLLKLSRRRHDYYSNCLGEERLRGAVGGGGRERKKEVKDERDPIPSTILF